MMWHWIFLFKYMYTHWIWFTPFYIQVWCKVIEVAQSMKCKLQMRTVN